MAYIRETFGAAAAQVFVERVLAACARLAELPRSGRACPELGWRLRRFPVAGFVVFFRPMAYGIQVVRLLHQARDLEAELPRRRKHPRKPVPPKVRKRSAG